jgi:hypothetical protein
VQKMRRLVQVAVGETMGDLVESRASRRRPGSPR